MKMQHHSRLLPAVSTLLSVLARGSHLHFTQSLVCTAHEKAAVAGGGATHWEASPWGWFSLAWRDGGLSKVIMDHYSVA